MKHLLQLAAAALAVLGLSAQAKVINHANYLGNFSFTTATAAVPLSKSDVGDIFVMSVNAPAAGSYLLTYSAECAVDAPNGSTADYLDIDLIVNGVAVAPTAGDKDALCSADGTSGFNRWVRRSITIGVFLNAGNNTLQVLGRLNNTATGGWLGDGTIIVYQ